MGIRFREYRVCCIGKRRTTDSDIDNLIFDGLKEKEDDKVVVGAFLRVRCDSAISKILPLVYAQFLDFTISFRRNYIASV